MKKLTDKQIGMMPEWVDKWVKIGLSTEPANFEEAEKGVRGCYRVAKLSAPKVILRMSSPLGCVLGGVYVSQVLSQVLSQVRSQVSSQVGSEVSSQVGSEVRSQVESHVESQVLSQVRSQVSSQVGSEVSSQVGSEVRSQVRSQVESQVRSQVESQVLSQVRSQVSSQVRSQVSSQVGSEVRSQYRAGNLWAGWYAYVSFLRDVCGWKGSSLEAFAHDERHAINASWCWYHDMVASISDRPCKLNRDGRGRLHCETGPALAYRDGWELWYIHGVSVPRSIVESPEKLTMNDVDGAANAELRRIIIERFGFERYLREAGARMIQRDDFGVLYRKEVADEPAMQFVEVVNSTPEPDGTFKKYILPVRNTVKSAHEAVAQSFGLETKSYNPQFES